MNTFTGILLIVLGIISITKAFSFRLDDGLALLLIVIGIICGVSGSGMFIYGILPLLSLLQ